VIVDRLALAFGSLVLMLMLLLVREHIYWYDQIINQYSYINCTIERLLDDSWSFP